MGGFSGGFAKGLAGVMKTTREQELRKEREDTDRALRTNLAILGPAIQAGIESGDFTAAERILIEINPDYKKRFAKGSPFETLGPILKEQARLEAEAGGGGLEGGHRGAGGRGSAAIESAPAEPVATGGEHFPGDLVQHGPPGPDVNLPGDSNAPVEIQPLTQPWPQTPGEQTPGGTMSSTVNRILQSFGVPPMPEDADRSQGFGNVPTPQPGNEGYGAGVPGGPPVAPPGGRVGIGSGGPLGPQGGPTGVGTPPIAEEGPGTTITSASDPRYQAPAAPRARSGAPAEAAAQEFEDPTLFGVPFGIGPEERAVRAQEAEVKKEMSRMIARRRIGQTIGLEGDELEDYVKYGTRAPGDQGGDFTLNPDAIRFDKDGNVIARGTASEEDEPKGDEGTFNAQVRRRTVELGRDLTGEEVATLRQEFFARKGDADGDAEGVDPAARARAELVARNPEIAQGWTPTARKDAFGIIGQDPELHLSYLQSAQAPARALATELKRSLGALLDTNPETGNVIGLSKGAATLYGPAPHERIARYGRAYGREAAASLAQLTSQEVLDEMARMKAQSPTGATGFGQLNIAELELLISAATVLKSSYANDIGEERALTELTAIYDSINTILADSDMETELQALIDAGVGRPETGGGGGGSAASGYFNDGAGNIVDVNGNLVPTR